MILGQKVLKELESSMETMTIALRLVTSWMTCWAKPVVNELPSLAQCWAHSGFLVKSAFIPLKHIY